MFSRMISHFGDKPRGESRKKATAAISGGYSAYLRRVYSDVYGR